MDLDWTGSFQLNPFHTLIDSRRAESVRNPIALHVKFGDDSALNTLTRTQWTAALTQKHGS